MPGVDGECEVGRLGELREFPAIARTRAVPVERAVVGDAVEKRGELAAPLVVGGEGLPGGEEDFLREVVAIGSIAKAYAVRRTIPM